MSRRTFPGGRLARRALFLFLGVLAILAYGIVGYLLFGFGLVDSVYMTALAVTTAGFTPVGDLEPMEKVFTVSVAVLGVSAFLAILASLGEALAEGQFIIGSRRRRMQRRIDGLEKHFILCAYGRVGRAVAREFEADGADFVVLDQDSGLEEKMIQDGVHYLVGDPSSEPVLLQAGIRRARALVCAMDSDAMNVFITIVARSLNPEIHLVARSSEATAADRLYRAGVDRVISPYVSSGRQMALLAMRPRIVDYLEVGVRNELGIRLEELLVEKTSPLIGKPLGETRGGAVVLAVRRQYDGVIEPNPGDGYVVEEGDLLVLMGEKEALRPVEEG